MRGEAEGDELISLAEAIEGLLASREECHAADAAVDGLLAELNGDDV